MRRVAPSSTVANRLRLAGLLALPVALAAVPMQCIEQGESLCLILRFTGRPCYGCGMTRALFALLHFDFAAAWAYHPASYPVAALLAYLYLKALRKTIGRP